MSNDRSLADLLNEREQEILVCLVEGLSNREIARKLHLAYRTVKWYNSKIYSKLGVNNRDNAVEQAEQLGLLEKPADTTQVQGKHNLPEAVTEFVGRETEIADVLSLVESDRLVMILAPGGMGKTRLSLEVARQNIAKYHDGVYFVPLAPLDSPDDIVTTIAENIGFVFHGDQSPTTQLTQFLKHRTMLLILDNFEHLMDGADLVNEIVKSALDVRLLITSRERLNLRGEIVYSLRGLTFPTWETPEDALEYDAVKLFLGSARRARPDFDLHSDDLDYLARICKLTEGMPLGIELAAGWVDVLSLAQISKELQQGIDILETEMRDVPERHRSLRATFERTWNRLTDDERDVFMKLSVFRGGFTLDAAGAVADANARHIRKLAQKALVQTEQNDRYGIHELLRQFGEARLQASGELEAIKTRHAEYFITLLEPLDKPEWHAVDENNVKIVKNLISDFDNARTAWQFYVQTKNVDGLSRMLNGIWIFMDEDNRTQDGIDLFEPVLGLFENAIGDETIIFRSRIMVRLAWFYIDLGQRYRAINIFGVTLPILKEYDLIDEILIVYFGKSMAFYFTGQFESYLDIARQGYELSIQSGNKRFRRRLSYVTGAAYYVMERYQEAVDWILSRSSEDHRHFNLGTALYRLGRYEEARPYLIQSEKFLIEIQTKMSHYYTIMGNRMNMIYINMLLGRQAKARAYLRQTLNQTNTDIYWWVAFEVLEVALDILIADGMYETAIEIVALLSQQPDDLGRVRKLALRRQEVLRASVAPDIYADAWERGSHASLETLVNRLLHELDDEE